MGFDLKNYEEVKDRIPRFLGDHGDGRIITDLITNPLDLATVVIKASLYIGETLVSTGYAFENQGSNNVNRTSHLENCETSAIGRCLANYGYCGSIRPSREEMRKVEDAEPVKKTDVEIIREKKESVLNMVKGKEVEYIGAFIDQGIILKSFKDLDGNKELIENCYNAIREVKNIIEKAK
jgi:hypothetical protein